MPNGKTLLAVAGAAIVMVLAVMGALQLAGKVSEPRLALTGGTVSKSEIEQIVRNYILEHPEIIFEAVARQQENETNQELARMRDGIAKNQTELFRESEPLVAGNPKGDVTIVEFFDYHCGFCKKVRNDVATLLKDDPGVRLVLKEFPILGPQSEVASRAAIASAAQGKYWDFHLALLGGDDLSEPAIMDTAKKVGLDVERLKQDMKSAAVQQRLDRNFKLADAMGTKATPTFVFGQEPVSGAISLSRMKELIADARKKNAAASN